MLHYFVPHMKTALPVTEKSSVSYADTAWLRTVDDVRTKIQLSTGLIFIPELAA